MKFKRDLLAKSFREREMGRQAAYSSCDTDVEPERSGVVVAVRIISGSLLLNFSHPYI